ncbi:MAG: M4 family metallopeptidase, partial [Lysobacter sp.]
MHLKTALLSTAVIAGLVGVAAYRMDSTSAPRTSNIASNAIVQGSTQATPSAHAIAAAAAAQNHAALRALIDTSARPGSAQRWASSSPEEADRSAAAEHARRLLNTVAAREVNLAQADGFVARDVMIDRDGSEHVRMERSYSGLPVIGGDMVVHSRDGQLTSISQGDNMRTLARPDLTPGISPEQAKIEAGAAFKGKVTSINSASLVVFARATEPTLAYQVDLRGEYHNDPKPGNVSYFLDAKTGKLLQEDDHVHAAAATGTGKSLTLGNVNITTNSVSGGFTLTDPTRGNGQTIDARDDSSFLFTYLASAFNDADNVWGNNAITDRASAAVDAYYGVAATWDYYKVVHGRNGIKNNGVGVKSYVHYGKNVANAFWNNGSMLYGDGNGTTYGPMVVLDMAGHEMTHGVTEATANLGYYNLKDTGGLNEGMSDIIGALVEFSVGNANDPGDYLFGEEIHLNNPGDKKAFRFMFNPSADGASLNCYPAGGFTAADTVAGAKYD